MKQLAISLVAAFLVACPSPLGQRCGNGGECGAGYTCVYDVEMYSPTMSRYLEICARSCERNTDCGPGVDCRLNNRNIENSGYCNDFGTLAMGERCSDLNRLRECGPGLACSPYTSTCVPACNFDSPLLEERRCAAGTTCVSHDRTYTLDMRTVSFTSYCEAECDPAQSEACRPFYICARWTSPGIGETTTCESAGGEARCRDGSQCMVGEICRDNTCYAPADAPPRRPEDWFPPLTAPTE